MIINAHKGAVSCTINCGQTGEYFQIQRGLRQGSPLSPILFDLSVEILGLAIRQNREIEGTRIGNYHKKLAQYADDLWTVIKGTEKCFDALMETFEDFAKISGLHINAEKTQLLRIGSLANSNITFPSSNELKWTKEINILGISYCADRKTILGKILLINSILASQTVYKLLALRVCLMR